MSSNLLPSLIIVHKIIDDDLGDSPVLHNSNMVKPLLTDSLRLDEGQEVPLWQHPHLGDETRLAQKRTIPFLPLKLREINSTLSDGMTGRIDILQPFLANPFR